MRGIFAYDVTVRPYAAEQDNEYGWNGSGRNKTEHEKITL